MRLTQNNPSESTQYWCRSGHILRGSLCHLLVLYLGHSVLLSILDYSSRCQWCDHRWSCSDSHKSGDSHSRMFPRGILGRRRSHISQTSQGNETILPKSGGSRPKLSSLVCSVYQVLSSTHRFRLRETCATRGVGSQMVVLEPWWGFTILLLRTEPVNIMAQLLTHLTAECPLLWYIYRGSVGPWWNGWKHKKQIDMTPTIRSVGQRDGTHRVDQK